MSAGSELLGYTGAALRLLQSKGDVDSTWYGDEVLGSVNSIPSRMNPPISTHTKNRIALPLSIGVHSTGIACEDQATSSAESSPRAGGGVCNSSTPLANTSPVRGSSTVPSLDDSMALPVPATVKVSAKKVREIHSPYSTAKGVPLECRRGNNKHAQGSHLRVFHKSLRQGVLHTAEEGSAHQLDTSDDSIVISITESGDNCKLGKLKLLEKQSTEQEAHQVFITPVIVSCPQNISPADLDRPAKGSRALQGKAGAAWGEPAQPESLAGNMCAARHGQGPLPLTDRGAYRDVADVVLPTSAMGPGTCCHDSDRAHTVGATSCTRSHAGTSTRDLEDHIHDRSLDVLKKLQSLEHLHRACTVNSAKLLTKACDDVIQMAQKKDTRATCSTRDQERDKPIRMADDSTQTVQEQLLVTAAPKKEHSMECMPADKDKHPIIYSHVERTLPPVEQLGVLVEATKVLDEVKRAHEALETESVLLERRHRTGLGKLLNQCQSGPSDLKEKKKVEATNDVLVRRQGKKEAVKGSLKSLAKHKSYQSSKHPGEVKHVPQQRSAPSSTQIGAGAMRRIGGPASAVGRDMHHVRPVGAGQQARVAIPPPPLQARVAIPPPPPPPPPLNAPHHPVSSVTSSAVNAHPLQTSAIPMFTPQVVPSHGTARQQHSSEASTQTQLFAGKPGSAAVVGCCEMGTQAGGGGAAMEPTSKSLVVMHLPLVNISTSLEGSMTTLEQDEDAVEQEVFHRSCSTAASAKPMGDSGHENEENAAVSQQLEEVVICGQNGPPVQLDSAPLFRPQTYSPLGGRCQGTTMSSEELEQRLNEHVTFQALQWVQQELFAQAMAQVSLPSDPTTVLHQDPSSNSCSTCPSPSNHSMAQSYGGGVLQWFADSGIPVDSELVHKLVQEIVVEEGVALGGDEANKDRVSEERSSESEEEFSYTPPASSDASTVTMVPTPKPTPSPSPPASPPPCESANPLFVETVLTPNPTPPPASPKSQRPIQLQDKMLATPQSTEAEDLVAQTSVATSHSQPSWHVQEVEGICTPSTTPPPPPQLLLSPMSTPASTVEITHPPPTQPTIEESPATKEPSLSESATSSSSSCVVHSSAVHNTTTSTSTDREISMGELIKQSVSHEPGVSFSEGEVPLSPGDARWKAFHTKIGSLFPATKQLPIAHQTPILDCKTVGGASREDFSEMSSDSTQYGIEVLSEGQATRGLFGGFLSKLSTSTPENSTQTPNHTDDNDDDSTHPATDTTFAEDICTSLPATQGPGQLGAPHGPGQLGAPHGPGQLGAPHGPGQLGAASPGEVRKPAFVNYSMSQSECDLDSMASASEGEVRLETRNGIDVIRVSRRSSGTLAESKALKRKYEAATSGQHITVSETAPLQHQGYARGDAHGDAAGDICSSKAYPVILVAEGKKRQ